jgi:adhesin transport system membrane fusion protein
MFLRAKPFWLIRFECGLAIIELCMGVQVVLARWADAWQKKWRHVVKAWRDMLLILRTLKAEAMEVDAVDPAHADDIDYASSAVQAVLHQDPRGARQILLITSCFLLVCFLWAAFAKIDEYTRGTGKVVPSGRLQVVQNLEGGIVAELFVREGQIVTRDEPLLRIDDTQFSSSYREKEQKRQYLRMKTARLQAEVEGESFESVVAELRDTDPAMLQQETNLYLSRQQELHSQISILDEQVTQKRHELEESKSKADQLSHGYDLAAQELQMTEPLVAQGAISKVEVLRLRRQTLDIKGQRDVMRLEISKLAASLQEAQNKYDGVRLQFVSKAQQELSEAAAELGNLEEMRGALEDRVKRTIVRSPVAGQINRLLINTIGGVVQPGMDLVEVVPTEDSLLVEARISPVDIAYLHPGQKAVIKITAYDFTVFGGLDGELVQISPDSLVDDKGNSYYVVRVQTDQLFLGKMGRTLEIIPGMTADVEILTGEKTVLSYILKPVLRAKSRAFSER